MFALAPWVGTIHGDPRVRWKAMGCLVAIFLLAALVFAGAGFAVHLLWIFAVVFFVCWVAGFAFGRGARRSDR
jgi:hypothetical protein